MSRRRAPGVGQPAAGGCSCWLSSRRAPCYISAFMPDTREDQLRAGREALTRHAWKEAFERLQAADAAEPLSPQDLELFAEAAQWLGQLDEQIAGHERAFKSYLE